MRVGRGSRLYIVLGYLLIDELVDIFEELGRREDIVGFMVWNCHRRLTLI